MIDEDTTLKLFGYTSDGLSKGSHKPIVRICDNCGECKIVQKRACSKLCHPCIMRKITKNRSLISNETRLKMSKSQKGRIHTKETKLKIGNGNKGKIISNKTKQKLSAWHQGISINEWCEFSIKQDYCPKFNESCRESNRNKYNRECFICGKNESQNLTKSGKQRKLSVHHVDMNKDQGCDDHEWELIPVCMKHHRMLHNDLWIARIKYLIKWDKFMNNENITWEYIMDIHEPEEIWYSLL